MKWDRLEGQWKQKRGKASRDWGKIMSDELAEAAGKYEELVGKLQEKYGIAREHAQRRIDRLTSQYVAYRRTSGEQLRRSNRKVIELRKELAELRRTRNSQR